MKFPKEEWDEIRIGEKFNEEGTRKFEELSKRFYERAQAQRDYEVNYPAPETPGRKVLDAYYETFELSRIGNSNKIDWLKWNENQAELKLRIDAGEFGDPARASEFIEERSQIQHAPEVQWYFDNDAVMDAAGYWDLRTETFEQFRPVLASRGFGNIDTVTELQRVLVAATANGDQQTALVLGAFLRRIDAITGRQREIMRRQNPILDEALFENGWVSKPLRSTVAALNR